MSPNADRFVAEYLIDLNGRQAAIRSGYSPKTAEQQASRLLRNPKVAAAIQAAMNMRAERTRVTADSVLLEIERLAMFDPKDLTTVTSPAQIADLDEDVRRAIVGWSWDRMGNFIIKTAKEKALEMLGRHHKLFVERVEHTGADGGPIELSDTDRASRVAALLDTARARRAGSTAGG